MSVFFFVRQKAAYELRISDWSSDGCPSDLFGPVSDSFDAWRTAAATADPATRDAALANWADAPGARQSHPVGGEEHLLPLMIAAGAAGGGKGARIFSDRVMETTISAFRFD